VRSFAILFIYLFIFHYFNSRQNLLIFCHNAVIPKACSVFQVYLTLKNKPDLQGYGNKEVQSVE